jgi:putative colanic acid biosynthesis acetyltransferase WcaF
MRSRVRIHFPWNLIVGNDCWIGEGAWIINHAMVTLGDNVCISQEVIICSSGHDLRTASLDYKHRPIEILDGAWVCLKSTLLAGAKVGVNSVVSAGETFSGFLKDGHIYIKGESKPIENLN